MATNTGTIAEYDIPCSTRVQLRATNSCNDECPTSQQHDALRVGA